MMNDAGSFTHQLVQHVAEVLQKQYLLDKIDSIASIPPTKSAKLVETFAQNIAEKIMLSHLV